MEQQIQAYLDHIRNDYVNWNDQLEGNSNIKIIKIKAQMIEEFLKNIRIEEGRTYIKVIARTSVHSFIVKEDGPKFRRGDILKAASWKAPAKNFARGNILDGKWSNTTWTGA